MRTDQNSETDSPRLYVEEEEPGYGMPKRLTLQVATLLIGLKEQPRKQLHGYAHSFINSIECVRLN